MGRLLPNALPRNLVHIQEGPPPFAARRGRFPKTLVVTVIGFASSGIGVGYFVQEHPTVAILSSLLIGFAPLIGLFVLLVINALLISFLISTFERTLTDGDDGIVPEPRLKSKWHHVAPFLPDQLAFCLSLKEHSPPALRFF